MVSYESGFKWTESIKRWPLSRAAGGRTAWTVQNALPQSGLQPPDRRRLIWLAIACMAYPFGESQPFIGLLFVSCSLVGILAIRLHQVRQEAGRIAAELRVKNEEMTRLQRNAERLAELSVQEERGRIAHEIHDVVGHTLTAAIVQLEVTKKIAEQQGCVPPEKLELLNGLVRKGLDDIRRAVKLMRSDEATKSQTLEEALRELIQSTEETMEIAIETDISLSPRPELGRLTEQALYHALQEGLTNGIRHGKCARASFSLRASNGMLKFLLVSDGEPFGSAAPGFGLSSMIKRVKLLGGGVSIRSSVDADGKPFGCELEIEMPLAA